MFRLFTIAICICCLFLVQFILGKNIKQLMKFILLAVFFIILQITSTFLKHSSFNYYILVDVLSAVSMFFIVLDLLNKKYLTKEAVFFYTSFTVLNLILNRINLYIYLDCIINLLVWCFILKKTMEVYTIKKYKTYKSENSRLNRLKIIIKAYNDKLSILKEKNIKQEELLDQNIYALGQILLNLKSKVYFIDQTLNYVYTYNFEIQNMHEVEDFKSFFNKESPTDLIILEKLYNALYDCENHFFEIKDKKNKYCQYRLYPNTLLEGTLGVLFVKTDINHEENLKNEYMENNSYFKNIVDKMPYDVILERNNQIVYQNRKSKYEKNIINIILDSDINGNITYTLDDGKEKYFYMNKISLNDEQENLIILKDITSQRALINKMNLAKQKYELFVDIISEAVFVLDYNTKKIKYTNKSFNNILKQNKLDIVDVYYLIKNSDLNYCDLSFSMKFEKKKIKNSLNEDVYLEFANMILNINQKNIVIGVFRDITEEVKNKILNKKIREEAYTRKLKNDFLINLSHELKTPTNLIYLKNQLTRTICDKNNDIGYKTVRFLNRELENINILIELIDSIISMEKLDMDFYDDDKNFYNIY